MKEKMMKMIYMVMIELGMRIQWEELKKSRKSHFWSSSSFHSCYSSVSYEWRWKMMRLKMKAKEWGWSRFRTSEFSRWKNLFSKNRVIGVEIERMRENEGRIEKMREVESGSGKGIEQKSSCWQWCAWVARSDRTLADWLEWVRVLSRRRGEQGWMNEWDEKNKESERERWELMRS